MNSKYPIRMVITKLSKKVLHIKCRAADLDQEFLVEDLQELVQDIENLITPKS